MDLKAEKQKYKPARQAGVRTASRSAGLKLIGKSVAGGDASSETPGAAWFGGGPTEEVLLSLAKVVEQRDSHTAGHCERLAFTGVALGVAMRLESRYLLSLYLGGYLHDVGKVGIPDAILFKPGQLSDREWETMRTHPARGEEICRPLESMQPVLPLIRHHHERLDGTGYPDGLSGNEIPLLARVLQVVDIYDALTNPRPYKQAYTRPKALEILEQEAEKGWRDREVTSLFVRLHKRMHTKISDYRAGPTGGAPTMSQSLVNLQSFLAQ